MKSNGTVTRKRSNESKSSIRKIGAFQENKVGRNFTQETKALCMKIKKTWKSEVTFRGVLKVVQYCMCNKYRVGGKQTLEHRKQKHVSPF